MSVEGQIRAKLEAASKPIRLEIVNESHLHAGHASSPHTGDSHFRVLVVSEAFTGQSRVARHRMGNQTLAGELAGGVHALAIKAMTPAEVSAD